MRHRTSHPTGVTDASSRLRRSFAVAGILVLGSLLVAGARSSGGPVTIGSGSGAGRLLVLPLVACLFGLLRNRDWASWLGLAIGLTAVPWSGVLAFGTGPGPHATAARIAMVAAFLILGGLYGGGRIRVGNSVAGSKRDLTRSRWLRWSIIANMASALNLFAFVVAYSFRLRADFFILAALLGAVLLGVLLLARQRTLGLLLLWLSSVLFLPAGSWFVWREAATAADAVLFAVLFAPGVVTAWVTVVLFGRPVIAVLRSA